MKSGFFRPVVEALKAAGYEFQRVRANHHIFRAPQRPLISVPAKLDDRNLVQNILRRAGATFDR
jgi:predicted RNA binding protein YcfA (HicA-like mRNA interferase family)